MTAGPLERAVRRSLTTAKLPPADAGTVALARQYAALIDAAEPSAALARAIATVETRIFPAEPAVHEAWRRVTTALSEHTVSSDLGPKLLAALESLGLSPRARAAMKAGNADVPAPKTGGQLDELRKRRDGKRPPATDDAAASGADA